MAAPTLVSYNTPSSDNFSSTTTPKTTTAFDVVAGDIIVVLCSIENANSPTGVTPSASGGSVTWTLQAAQNGGTTNQSAAYCWTGVVGATATGITVSLARPSSDGGIWWGFSARVVRDHGGVGAAFSDNNGTGSGAPSAAATCAANSAVFCQINDWNAVDGTSRTWRTINGAPEDESSYFRDASRHTVYGGYKNDVGAGGSITQGLTAPATMRWVLVGVEVLASGGDPPPPTPVDHFGTGTAVAGTTSVSPALPASWAPGDIAVVSVASNHTTEATEPACSGYTKQGTLNGGGGSQGAGTGNRRLTYFTRELQSGDSNPTVTLATGNAMIAAATVLRLGTGYTLDSIAVATGAETTAGTGWTQAMTSNPGIDTADALVLACAVRDTSNSTVEGITATGATFGTVTERADLSSETGNDLALHVSTCLVSTGPASAAPTRTATHSTSETGVMGVLRVRAISAGGDPGEGTGTGSTTWTGAAVGKRNPVGTITGATTWTGTAAGARQPKGSATGSTTWTGTASGKKTPIGTATGATTWTGSAVGEAPTTGAAEGSASGATTWVGTAAGKRAPQGASTGSTVWTGTAAGKKTQKGTGTGNTTWTSTSTGKREPEGSATGSTTYVGAASGKRTPKGSSTGNTTWAGSATGKRVARGTAVGNTNWTGIATGKKPSKGASTGNTVWTGSAVGNAPDIPMAEGSATGNTAWTGSAIGIAPSIDGAEGIAVGTTSWSGTATGKRSPRGSANGTSTYTSAAQGKRTPKGSSSGSTLWSSSASGGSAAQGAAVGNVTWIGVATGRTDRRGSAVGATVWIGEALAISHHVAPDERVAVVTGKSRVNYVPGTRLRVFDVPAETREEIA